MAKKLGNDKRLFIQSTTPGTFNQLAGQRSADRNAKAGSIDIGDKNNAPYGLTAPGNFDSSLSCEGVLDLPDANGLERSYTLFKSRTAEVFQMRKAPFATGDVLFEGSCYILDFSTKEPRDGETTYSLSLGLAAAPTTDILG